MPMSQEQIQVQELVTKGRTQGYLTHEEVNRVLLEQLHTRRSR